MFSEILLTVNEWSSIFWSFVQKELLYSSILFLIVLGFTRVLKKKSLYPAIRLVGLSAPAPGSAT